MGYRENWFKHNAGVKRIGKTGYWYKCSACNKFFRKKDIEIDHRIPVRKGGTDDLWNLQPMCRTCNRSKGARQSGLETAHSVLNATMNGDLDKLAGNVAKRKVLDLFGVKYRR